ncbi:MAG TPA: DUF2304 domain-containing protein [Candidatus Nanoarchaeia archaeon]|nr:DUF2304 domain-containing protein [Candidatus Nanoarchaeia archaeon]
MNTTFWIQFLGIIFGLAMMYFTFVKFKRREISNNELLFWFLGWIVLVVIAIVPSALDFIIGPLNFYRRLDFFVVLGFFVLLGMGFYNYSLTKKNERKLDKFVRQEAWANLSKANSPENGDGTSKNFKDNKP